MIGIAIGKKKKKRSEKAFQRRIDSSRRFDTDKKRFRLRKCEGGKIELNFKELIIF